MTGAAAVADTTGIPPLRRDRRVHAWILSGAVSEAGDVAWYVGLAWSAAQVASPAGAGLVMGIGALPRALILLFGGALADRLDARRTMIAANLGRIVVLVAAALVVAAAGVSMALLLTVAILFGAVDALYNPASGTLPRRMVRSDDLVRLAATRQLANRLAVFVGAPLGGLLVAQGGLVMVMVADAISFGVIAVALAFVVRPRFPRPAPSGHSIRRDLSAGFGYLRRDRIARTLVIAFFGLNLCVGPVLAVGLVQRVHLDGWGSAALGWFQACSGISAAVGAVVALRWKPRLPPGRTAAAHRAGGRMRDDRAGAAGRRVRRDGDDRIHRRTRLGLPVRRLPADHRTGVPRSDLEHRQPVRRGPDADRHDRVRRADLADRRRVACALLGTAFAALMVWSASRLRG